MSTPLSRHTGCAVGEGKQSLLQEPLSTTAYSSESDTHIEEEVKHCRNCDSERQRGLIVPCLCDGRDRWVHRKCLDHQRVDTRHPENFYRCPKCFFHYRMLLARAPTEGGPQRGSKRRAVLKTVAQHSLLSFVVVQVWLFILAAVVHFTKLDKKVLSSGDFAAPLVDLAGKHPCAAPYGLAVGITLAIAIAATCVVLIVGLITLLLRELKQRIEREVWPEEVDRPQESGAAETVTGCNLCFCEDLRLHCGRLCEDSPSVSLPSWFQSILESIKNSFWHPHSHSFAEGATDGDGVHGLADMDGLQHVASSRPELHGEGAAWWALIAVIGLILIVAVAGIAILFVIAAMWLQKVFVKSFQLRELKRLSLEYAVEDLSKRCNFDSDDEDGGLPSNLEGQPPLCSPSRSTTIASLKNDLSYLYGYEVFSPPTTSTGMGVRTLSVNSLGMMGLAAPSCCGPTGIDSCSTAATRSTDSDFIRMASLKHSPEP